jgi:hypothetical protein
MNALAIRDDINLEQLQTLGQVFVQSKFFTDTTQAAQAIVKVLAGRELGFPEIASMTGVNIIKGKVSLSANLMASAIKRSVKYNYRIREHSDDVCRIEFFEDGESVGFSEFTRADAVKAGLNGDNWKKFPRNMMFARALSNGAKWHCPDIFGGPIYTPDELGATVNEEGEVIDLPVEPTTEPVIEAEPEPTEAPAMALADEPPDNPQAELRWLAWKLGYADDQLLKWLVKKYNLDANLKINDALLSLGEGELQQAIAVFKQHVEAKEAA